MPEAVLQQREQEWVVDRTQFAMLDGHRDERIDRIARLIGTLLETPFVRIALTALNGRCFQSVAEWPGDALGLSGYLDKTATELLECDDVSCDKRFATDPFVVGDPKLRFFASVPLLTPRGYAVGAVCVSDIKVRKLGERGRNLLTSMARLVTDQLEMLKTTETARIGLLARIVEESPDLIGSANAGGAISFINPAGRRLVGLSEGQSVSALHFESLQPEWASEIVRDAGIPTAIERGTWTGETAVLGAMGIEVPISQVIIAHRDNAGALTHLSTIARDISDLKAAQHAMRESEARFRGTFENAAVGIAHVGFDGRWLRVNQRLLDILGYERDELLQKTWQDITHPDDLTTDLSRFEGLKRGNYPSYVREKRYFRKDGSTVWINLTVAIQYSDDAKPLYCISVIEDIGARKLVEERQRLLLGELNHRVKNTLATIQSIANQSLRRAATPKEFVASFLGRIQSLSSAHNLLNQETWEGADLKSLVQHQVTVGGAVDDYRVRCEGPPVSLPPQIALNLALVLHELATNAMKHGALAREAGRIDVRWTLEDQGSARKLDLRWTESGGPPGVGPPVRSGFGTMLIERGLEQGLGGEVELNWRPEGLAARFVLPLPDEKARGIFSP